MEGLAYVTTMEWRFKASLEVVSIIEGIFNSFRVSLLLTNHGISNTPSTVRINFCSINPGRGGGHATRNWERLGYLTSDDGFEWMKLRLIEGSSFSEEWFQLELSPSRSSEGVSDLHIPRQLSIEKHLNAPNVFQAIRLLLTSSSPRSLFFFGEEDGLRFHLVNFESLIRLPSLKGAKV